MPGPPPDPERVARYFLGELQWEIDTCPDVPPELRPAAKGDVVFVSYQARDTVRLRVRSRVMDIRLSWRPDLPPQVLGVTDAD